MTAMDGDGHPVTGALPVEVNTTAVSVLVIGGAQRVVGWSFKESTGGATAEVQLLDGYDANGTAFAFITLSAGQSMRDVTTESGIEARAGVFAAVISGSIVGSVWVAQ